MINKILLFSLGTIENIVFRLLTFALAMVHEEPIPIYIKGSLPHQIRSVLLSLNSSTLDVGLVQAVAFVKTNTPCKWNAIFLARSRKLIFEYNSYEDLSLHTYEVCRDILRLLAVVKIYSMNNYIGRWVPKKLPKEVEDAICAKANAILEEIENPGKDVN